jgi:hypothetical protein
VAVEAVAKYAMDTRKRKYLHAEIVWEDENFTT